MSLPAPSRSDVLSALGYLSLGVVGTAITGIGVVAVLQPLQAVVYDAFYLVLGPWTATEAASIFHIGLAGVLAVAVPTVAAELLDGTQAARVAVGFAALCAFVVVAFVVAALLDLLGLLTVLFAYAVLVGVTLAGLYRGDASRGSTLAFTGGVPVLCFLVVLLAFGLGWGGGYDVVAEPIPASDAGDDVAHFEDAPQLQADLFGAQGCDPADDGVCRLSLRGYAHEVRAARFLDDHGVRCPFVNDPRNPVYDRDASFVAEHGGDYYRISCEAYGD